MQIFRDVNAIPDDFKGAVIALGNFDGLHLGHRAIIAQAKKIAEKSGKKLALMTFEPHPREVLAKGNAPMRIYSLRSKLLVAKSLGVEAVFLLRFNTKLSSLSAEDFIRNILHQKLAAHHVITGENFYFGKNRSGNAALLESSLPALGIGYSAHAPVKDAAGEMVSSSAIRALLAKGDIAAAEKLLGQKYHWCGRVVHGQKRGRELGFPTANIATGKLAKLHYGVYAVKAQLGDTTYNGVANFGVKPSVGVHAPLLEIHLFDTNQDLYGKRLYVEFIALVRDEKKFDSLDALKTQIAHDVATTKTLLGAL